MPKTIRTNRQRKPSTRRSGSCANVFPTLHGPDGKRICAVCRKPLTGRSRRYCSAACRDIAWIATNPGYARHKVYLRDKGVCSKCGCDTAKIDRILWSVRCSGHVSYSEMRQLFLDMGFNRGHLWEMDHIRPVSEGGGLCGLDNLRTLCVPCHRDETADLARRRVAEKQRAKWSLPLGGKK